MTVACEIMSACHSQVTQENTIQLYDRDGPSGIRIDKLGSFSNSSIEVLLRYDSIAKMQRDYQEEMAWLSFNQDNHTLADSEIKNLHSFFKSSPHDPLHIVASLDGIYVDLKSLSTLVGEHFIDNFVINYCLRKTLHLKQKRNNSILCLPTEALLWLENQVLEPIKTIVIKDIHRPQELKFILMPLHMETKQYWGLVCVDLERLTVWFDDGLKITPPDHLCSLVGRLVNVLSDMFPFTNNFNSTVSSHLSKSQWRRMCMPQQLLDGKTAGSGSCGMGVILLAQDIILGEQVPPHQITWLFQESNHYRKKLMLHILT